MNILVFGGSQGAQILSDIVPKAVAMLPQDMRQYVRITQQARKEDIGRVQSSYDLLGIRYEVKPFFGNLSDRISEAQLVICRAGASTLAELTVIGRPSILIPYPHAASDHQTVNSRSFVDAEAAVAIPESLLTPQSLAEMIITILGNPDGANQMAVSALSVGAPDAIERLMKLVEQTAAKVPN
jgi:UDP-N-acetylglucosamine--N-acetylmuramyl-(pentapeptide) pyrophosphoryl-undecaprenol N-acetylglucosamine transferase